MFDHPFDYFKYQSSHICMIYLSSRLEEQIIKLIFITEHIWWFCEIGPTCRSAHVPSPSCPTLSKFMSCAPFPNEWSIASKIRLLSCYFLTAIGILSPSDKLDKIKLLYQHVKCYTIWCMISAAFYIYFVYDLLVWRFS